MNQTLARIALVALAAGVILFTLFVIPGFLLAIGLVCAVILLIVGLVIGLGWLLEQAGWIEPR